MTSVPAARTRAPETESRAAPQPDTPRCLPPLATVRAEGHGSTNRNVKPRLPSTAGFCPQCPRPRGAAWDAEPLTAARFCHAGQLRYTEQPPRRAGCPSVRSAEHHRPAASFPRIAGPLPPHSGQPIRLPAGSAGRTRPLTVAVPGAPRRRRPPRAAAPRHHRSRSPALATIAPRRPPSWGVTRPSTSDGTQRFRPRPRGPTWAVYVDINGVAGAGSSPEGAGRWRRR